MPPEPKEQSMLEKEMTEKPKNPRQNLTPIERKEPSAKKGASHKRPTSFDEAMDKVRKLRIVSRDDYKKAVNPA